MLTRVLVAASVLIFGSSALFGVSFSDATWTAQSSTTESVTAAPDWTPPTVVVSALPAPVKGTVQVTATASDARSGIVASSVTLSYAPASGSTWTPLTGCTTSGANPLTLQCPWNSTSVADGSYQVRATATDTAGYAATSATVTASVLNTDGVVLSPISPFLRGTVAITGSAVTTSNNGNETLTLAYSSNGTTWFEINGSCNVMGKDPTLTCQWNTTAVPDGRYDVRASSNKSPTADIQRGILIDNTAPTATLTAPTGVLGGTVALTATAGDATSGVASVAFDHRLGTGGWVTCGTDVTAPYSCTLDTTALANGSYDFRATATDAAGNTTTSTVTRSVDNTPATVSITSPAAGAVLDGNVNVAVAAQSARVVTSVRVDYRSSGGNFTTVCTDTTAPYACSWPTAQLGNGSYELQAVLTQGSGADVTSAVRAVTVTHPATAVAITQAAAAVAISSPVTGATIRNQGTVSVTGTATAPAGVTAVTLRATPVAPAGPRVDTACTLGAGTFRCAWDTSGVVYGAYDLSVEMTQGDNVVLTAKPVRVTVDNVVASVSLRLDPGPAGGYVKGTESLAVTADSNLAVASVAYQLAPTGTTAWAALCPSVTTGPSYACAWDTTTRPNATYDLRAVMTLTNGATVSSSPVTVTVVNLRAADVQAGNGDGSIGAGDTLVLTYSTRVNLASIRSGWTGAATPVTLSFADAPDRVTVTDANLGQVTFAQDYVRTGFTLSATMTATESGGATVITLTLAQDPPVGADQPGPDRWGDDLDAERCGDRRRPRGSVRRRSRDRVRGCRQGLVTVEV